MPPPTLPTSTRATRSRFSSPMQSIGTAGSTDGTAMSGGGSSSNRHSSGGSGHRPNGTSGSSGSGVTNAQKALMQRWLEPPVQNKTSFEEAGFQRHGVFEGMAPLGSLPKPVNVAKRMSNLSEEKVYHDLSSHSGRHSAKQHHQSQKQKGQREQANRQEEQQQQQPRRKQYDSTVDNEPPEQEQQWARQKGPEKVGQEQDEEIGRRRQEEDQQPQQQQEHRAVPAPLSKKIILKRPSATRHVPTRIIVGPRRSLRADNDAHQPENEHGEHMSPTAPADSNVGGHDGAAEALPESPTSRRTIIIGPASGGSHRRFSSVTSQASARKNRSSVTIEVDPDLDHEMMDRPSSPESVTEMEANASTTPTKPAAPKEMAATPQKPKRPVGRPRSRRSIAAESWALKTKAEAEAMAAAEKVAAEAAAEEAARLAAEEADTEIEDEVTAIPESAEDSDEVGTEIEVLDSDETESALDDDETHDDETDDDETENDGSAIVLDSSILPLSSHFNFSRPRSDSNATMVNKEVTDKVVDVAVEEALRHFRYPTAWALRTLYDERSGNQNFLAMVEDVFQQTADRETLETFARLIHEKKKEGKKDNRGCYFFVPPVLNNRFTPHSPRPAPYGRLITMVLPRFVRTGPDAASGESTNAPASKRVKLVNADNELGSSTAEPAFTQHLSALSRAPVPDSTQESSAAEPSLAGRPSVSQDVGENAGGKSLFLRKTAREDETQEQPKDSPLQSPKIIEAPTEASVAPRTPTKPAGRRPGRPPGSKKDREAAQASSTRTSGRMSARKSGADDGATPSSSRRLRNHANSSASSISSLSSAMSLSPPGKTPRSARKGNKTASADLQEQEMKDADAHSDAAMSSSVTPALTSFGWTTDTVSRKAESADGRSEPGGDSRTKKDDGPETPQPAATRRGGGVDRPRTGSGRGGRRRGAGRPRKNRGVAGFAGASATPSAAQPIGTQAPAAAKMSPTPPASALISPSSPSSQTNQAHTTNSQHTNHHHTTRNSAAAAAAATPASAKEMPAAIEEPISVRSISVSKRAQQNGTGKGRGSAALSSPALKGVDVAAPSTGKSEQEENDEEHRSRLRREARNVTNSVGVVQESFARGAAGRDSHDETLPSHAHTATPGSHDRRGSASDAVGRLQLLETPQPQQRQLRASTTTARTTRSARKRAFDEIEDDLSPRSGSFASEEPPSVRLQTPVPTLSAATANASNRDSRPGTPGPKAKKPRVGLRVKTSPVKRKTGTSAGVPRPSGERGSPVANGNINSQDDNDDYCASCGGSGDLVCCDGCTRSFHFKCVDPPVHEDRELPDEWFCNVCVARRSPASLTRHSGLFGTLLNLMEKKNSSAFRLPSYVRDCFEGVKTGIDGEYEDAALPGANRNRKRGYEEAPDFFRVRDAEGHAVLCHSCNRSAEESRAIIPCAFCGLWWHTDCLDPPMANPPVLRNWRCPAHADDVLSKLPSMLGPAHRFRKIKFAPTIKPSYSRGMMNNGFIEFNSEDESDDNSGWKDVRTFGRVYRVGARGVELDFLERIRKEQHKGKQRHARINRLQERVGQRPPAATVAADVVQSPVPNFDAALPDSQKIDGALAAHNISALMAPGDRTGDLINALLSQADPATVSLMAQGSSLNFENGPSSLTQADVVALQAMRARIDRLLAGAALLGFGSPQPEEKSASASDQSSEASAEREGKARGTTAEHGEQTSENCPGATASASSAGVHAGHVPEIEMQDALSPAQQPNSAQASTGEPASLEANEVMSLVSDNGESDLNDEDPLPIATPRNIASDDPSSGLWPVEQPPSGGSEPGSGNNALLPAAKVNLAADGDISSFRLCDELNNSKSMADAAVKKKTESVIKEDEGQRTAGASIASLPPLTCSPTSEELAVVEDHNKENEACADRLDKQLKHGTPTSVMEATANDQTQEGTAAGEQDRE